MEIKESAISGVINPDKYYTKDETMTILNIKSYVTLWSKVREGYLIRSKIGGIIHYQGKDIINFLENGKV